MEAFRGQGDMATARRKKSARRDGQESVAPPASYQPLASVWHGTDAELLEKMLAFYPRKPPELILDATVNAGRFWEGSPRKVVGMDIDARHRPDVVGDNRRMPFKDEC